MPEMIVIPHPDEQRSYFELREEFRHENQHRIHDQLFQHPLGWGVLGDPNYARDRYAPEEWARELDLYLRDSVIQDFGLPGSDSEQLEKLAKESILFESATWEDGTEGVVDHDAPACKPIDSMTEQEICDYVAWAIKESHEV